MKKALTLFLVCICSCSHQQKFDNALIRKDCDQALLEIPENQKFYKVAQVSQQGAGYLVSYSFTGAAYTAQILWDVTAGITASIILCAPAIALQVSVPASERGQGSDQFNYGPTCFPAEMKPLLAPSLGKRAYDSTESLRCPPLVGISQSLRKVAQCYVSRKKPEDQLRAIAILKSVTESGSFYQCLSFEERESILTELKSYQNNDVLIERGLVR
ncbi:MAG: hypothetical protein RJB66_1943 [Pseudomonadota bacterium]|jgi:hypothetical protein